MAGNRNAQAWVTIGVVLAVAWLVTLAGSQGGERAGSVPVFALCAPLSFGIQWLAFVPAYAWQTERFYDLTGSLTYLALLTCALAFTAVVDARAMLLAGLVAVWAVRLGSFLFLRIQRDRSDRRFDAIKPSLPRFLMAWTLQGLWVFLTLAAALAAISSGLVVPIGGWAALGAALFVAGFLVEVVADQQKQAFRADPANANRFIHTGLWAWSRHPNYFGEILLWLGIALVALPALSGWQYVTLVSPVFVFVLLTRISGVPLLEARASKKWGEDEDYRAYRARTPVLVLRPPR